MSELTAIKDLLEQHIATSNSQFKEIRSSIDVQNERITMINNNLTRMNFILLGDDGSKTEGLVHKVDKHGKYISDDRKFKWTVAGIMTGGMGGGLTALWAYIKSKLGA